MAILEATLYTKLSTTAGIAALVGTRIYPMIMPQGSTYPAVTFQRIATEPRESCMVADCGIVRARIQITAWADTFTAAKAVADQVRQALQRWTGTGIQGSFIIGEYDLYDEEALKYGAAIDAEVVYTE
jgi:hypothetical protein